MCRKTGGLALGSVLKRWNRVTCRRGRGHSDIETDAEPLRGRPTGVHWVFGSCTRIAVSRRLVAAQGRAARRTAGDLGTVVSACARVHRHFELN